MRCKNISQYLKYFLQKDLTTVIQLNVLAWLNIKNLNYQEKLRQLLVFQL